MAEGEVVDLAPPCWNQGAGELVWQQEQEVRERVCLCTAGPGQPGKACVTEPFGDRENHSSLVGSQDEEKAQFMGE